MKKTIIFGMWLTLASLISLTCLAQPDNPPSDLNQEAFRSWLKTNWFDAFESINSSTSSGYTQARLEMYNNIDPMNDTLFGFYSDYTIVVPSSGFSTPSDISPMDCEHIVPQSIFNSAGPMKNDIHHLAPTYSNWNSTRGSLPFGDNEDLESDKWMRFDEQINCSGSASCPPDLSIRDQFSEVINNDSWEPREEVKGNVARAVFYFFTMYPQFNIEAVADIHELYTWHLEDLPDDEELDRNDEVESFQGNRNPYIDHTDWVHTAWIDTTSTGIFEMPRVDIEVYPNPADIEVHLKGENYPVNYTLIDVYGQIIKTGKLQDPRQAIQLEDMSSGIYYLKTQSASGELGFSSFIKN